MEETAFRAVSILLFVLFVLWASDAWRSGEDMQAAEFGILAVLTFLMAMWR